MGFSYALVHLIYNIPLATLLTALCWPFMSRLDWSKVWLLVTISLLSTIPWDSYLVRNRIWTYPADAILGHTLFSIPLEEIFFFMIQTYNTSMIYINLTRRLVLPAYIQIPVHRQRITGILVICSTMVASISGVLYGGRSTYLGLILGWASLFLLIQWCFSSSFLCSFPRKELLISVLLPTAFLWAVDTASLKRGTWVIETSTKLNIQVWPYMDLEEAVFFLVTNMMIVGGLVAIDHAISLTHCHQAQAPGKLDSPLTISRILGNFLRPRIIRNDGFISSLRSSVKRLSLSSQSMYLGSALFQGALRIDLIFLYSFCRVIDDLVDEAPSSDAARAVIEECRVLLRAKFSPHLESSCTTSSPIESFGYAEGSSRKLMEAVNSLPASRLSIRPFESLLEGFYTDLKFCAEREKFPITSQEDLDSYSYHVAGTVGTSIIDLLIYHFPDTPGLVDVTCRREILTAGETMGMALQYVNIGRDVGRDAAIGRVYLPSSWLKEEGLSPEQVIANPSDIRIERVRDRVLERARALHGSSMKAIKSLPAAVQGPIRATVDSYMEIGAALRRGDRPQNVHEKLKLRVGRRLWVAYRAMAEAV